MGFLNAYALSHDEKFLDAACGAWKFIEGHLLDRVSGEWLWRVPRGGGACDVDEKAGPWKCPYHNARMCLQVMERVDALLKEVGKESANGQEHI